MDELQVASNSSLVAGQENSAAHIVTDINYSHNWRALQHISRLTLQTQLDSCAAQITTDITATTG